MNISIQPSFDLGYFNRMINHPEISPYVRDDRYVNALDCSPLMEADGNVFLQISVDGEEAGFAIMIRMGDDEYEMHSGILPPFRGQIAVEAGRGVIEWMGEFGAKCLRTFAWENARHVRLMARMVGFEEVSRQDWPYTVNQQSVRRINYAIQYVEPFRHLNPTLETFLSPCL